MSGVNLETYTALYLFPAQDSWGVGALGKCCRCRTRILSIRSVVPLEELGGNFPDILLGKAHMSWRGVHLRFSLEFRGLEVLFCFWALFFFRTRRRC